MLELYQVTNMPIGVESYLQFPWIFGLRYTNLNRYMLLLRNY